MKQQYENLIEMEKDIAVLKSQMKTMMENHLPHIQKTVDRILWLIITTLLGIVVHGALTYFQIK